MISEVEQRTLRKISWRIVPFIMLLYFIAYIDRVNIGFASLTMNKDLGFSSAVFGFGAGIFFLGYFLFEVPSNVILEQVGARLWIARVMITWGIISAVFAFIQGETSFYVLRFLLGAAEAGFFPGIILYLSYWFPGAAARPGRFPVHGRRADLGRAGLASLDRLLQMDGVAGLHGWQWMFLLEAIPAVLLGFVVLSYMTDRPEKATWLAEDEREWLVNTMNAEHAAKGGKAHHSIWSGLTDMRVLALALIYFGTSAGLYTLGIWAPQIIGVRPLDHAGRPSQRRPAHDRHRRHDPLGPPFRPDRGADLARRHRLLGRGRRPCARRGRQLGRGGRRGSDAGQCRHQRGEAAAVEPCRRCSCRARRRRPASRRSTRSGTLAASSAHARSAGSRTRPAASLGGLYLVAGLLFLSAILTLVLAGSQRAAPGVARSANPDPARYPD